MAVTYCILVLGYTCVNLQMCIRDSIQVSPIGARPITLGGKTAKTQQMTDAERKNIEDVNHEIGPVSYTHLILM